MGVFDVCCRVVKGAGSNNDEKAVILLGYDLDGFLSAFSNNLVGLLRLYGGRKSAVALLVLGGKGIPQGLRIAAIEGGLVDPGPRLEENRQR